MSFNINNTGHERLYLRIDILNFISNQLTRYLPIIFTIIGTIGFIGNLFTFLQPKLRKNTFCLYSLFGSICDILNLYINLLPNYIYKTNNILALISDTASCKWKLFGLILIPQMSLNFLTVSLIDRYSCSCGLTSRIRKICQLKTVPYITVVTILLSAVMSLYGPLLYEYMPGVGCVTTEPIANGVLYTCIHGLLTPLIMLVFIYLTFRNTRRSRQRVVRYFH